MRCKAEFKARREMLGMSQQLMARLLGVDVRTVKRWESPAATAYKDAPDDAWGLLDGFARRQRRAVGAVLDAVDAAQGLHGEPEAVDLTYWRSEAEYEGAHPGEGAYWQMANAVSRMAAWELESAGYEVAFGFPGARALGE